jgi:hypothetical protein
MTVLTQTWRQLVRRRLWPVALLLVAALVAVPVVLAKPATPPASPAPATAAAPATTPAQSYVALASDDTTTKPRRVLGARKDPFEPAPLPKVKHRKAVEPSKALKAQAPAATHPSETSVKVSSGGSVAASAGGAPVTPVAPAVTATPAPVKRFPANSVEVGFGKTDGEIVKSTLTRLETLPSSSSPLLAFMGFHKGGKVAEFMLTGDVTAEGDGTCQPSPQDCQTLLLHRGQTEFLTFAGTTHDGEYELDLNALHPAKTVSAEALKAKAPATPAVTATPTP